jgi:hypothetical protein
MISKFLEKKVEVILDGSSQKGENSLELEYYLLESDYAGCMGGQLMQSMTIPACMGEQLKQSTTSPVNEERKLQKEYGIEIVKKHLGILNERRQFANIFNTREKTKELIDLLVENTVTPSTLPYILDDLLGQ